MKELPVSVRRSIELLGLCAAGTILILGKMVLMPLLFAIFLSLLLLPVFRWLHRHHVPEGIAIFSCIIGLIIVVASVAAFLFLQVGVLLSDIATIQRNINIHWLSLSGWISSNFDYTLAEQIAIIRQQGVQLGNNVSSYLQGAFSSAGSVVVFVGLLPVYIFFVMYYRHTFYRFLLYWYPNEKQEVVHNVVKDVEVIVKYYLGGLAIQLTYLAILVGGILFLFGIKYAVLIGVTFAILNLLPYIGPLIGNLIGILLTLSSTQNFNNVIIVLVTIGIVQFFDNNIFFPRIMGAKVKVNSLASIVGIVAGGTIAGISGMFLSIPILAVLKIIFDKSDHLKQWGILLGENRKAKKTIFQAKY